MSKESSVDNLLGWWHSSDFILVIEGASCDKCPTISAWSQDLWLRDMCRSLCIFKTSRAMQAFCCRGSWDRSPALQCGPLRYEKVIGISVQVLANIFEDILLEWPPFHSSLFIVITPWHYDCRRPEHLQQIRNNTDELKGRKKRKERGVRKERKR